MNKKTPIVEPGSALAELRSDLGSRKRFLRMAGSGAAGGLAVMLAACGGDDEEDNSTSSQTTGESTPSGGGSGGGGGGKGAKRDLEIANYALTLEYLEATFYQEVIDSGMIKDKATASLAQALGEQEQAHVDALVEMISGAGGTPVEAPETNFEPVLEMGPEGILMTAATVENLGAAAYLGQAGRITNPDILAAALSIHSVEARHAAALNELVGRGFAGGSPLEGSIPDGPFAAPMDMDAVLKAVQPFLA